MVKDPQNQIAISVSAFRGSVFFFWMRRFCFFCRIESVWGSRATGRRGVGGTTERDTFAFEGETETEK